MAETLTTLTRLLIVREIQEDASGAVLRFREGGEGRLALRDAGYATLLRLARRSQERQHPVGVSFGEGQAITELIRADTDVPTQFWEEAPIAPECSSRAMTVFSALNTTTRRPIASAACSARRSGSGPGSGSSRRSLTSRCSTSSPPDDQKWGGESKRLPNRPPPPVSSAHR